MIRENRRQKMPKLSKNLERLFKEKKCRKCSVVVTRMDFAKILGKFTKVKIQYESASPPNKRVSTPSAKAREAQLSSPISNARLKSNENGMVLLPRNAYNEHPAKDLKSNRSKVASPKNSNVLKENNRLKKTPAKQKTLSAHKSENSNLKQYRIVFKDPSIDETDIKSKMTLSELVKLINLSILPSEEWCIDYFPRNESKDEKVYDRIAAELEDLMSNDKPKEDEKSSSTEKTDDFPSIMDILNDNTGVQNSNNTEEIKSTLESSDVEAMLLGKATGSPCKAMEVETNTLPEVENDNTNETLNLSGNVSDLAMPGSPSILNDDDEKATEEDKEKPTQETKENSENKAPSPKKSIMASSSEKMEVETDSKSETKISFDNNNSIVSDPDNVTFVIFKKTLNGKCCKSVTCTKNLKYTVEFEGKSVEFLGAPKYVSSVEDLEVLLQIVNESELQNLYVLHQTT